MNKIKVGIQNIQGDLAEGKSRIEIIEKVQRNLKRLTQLTKSYIGCFNWVLERTVKFKDIELQQRNPMELMKKAVKGLLPVIQWHEIEL